jgi:UPF0716 protein FxsA
MAILLVLILALPFVELVVLVRVAGEIGFVETVGLLIAVSIVGAWLAKRAGAGALNRIRKALSAGEAPDREVVDGALIMLAGLLLILPGFVSDVVGIALLIPPVRIGVRTLVMRRLGRSRRIVVVDRDGRARGGSPEVWDVDSWEDDSSPSRRQIGGGPA